MGLQQFVTGAFQCHLKKNIISERLVSMSWSVRRNYNLVYV